jgi:hypothetical protein
MNIYQRFAIAPIKQHADKPQWLFHDAQSTLNSAVRSKPGYQSREEGTSYSRRWTLRSGIMDVSGGMVRVRAAEQGSLEC